MGTIPVTTGIAGPMALTGPSENQPRAIQRSIAPPVNLVDPITSKKLKLYSPFNDRLLRLTPWQTFKLNLKNTFVTLPKTVYQGLRGDANFSFADLLNVSSIPYYLGGACLAASFAAGRDRVNFIRQAVGVGLYYLGVTAGNTAIDKTVKWRTGLDLNQRYRKSNGDIEKVSASVDWARFDLWSEQDYHHIAQKLGIPTSVADPKREVQEEVRRIISTARTDKLILGNLLAAVGAGYIARSDVWARLLGSGKDLKTAWKHPVGTGFTNRFVTVFDTLRGLLEPLKQEKLTGYVNETRPWLRKSVMGLALGSAGLILLHCLGINRQLKKRNYESPLTTALGAEINPQRHPNESYKNNDAARNAVFLAFERARADSTLSKRGPA